MLNPNNCVFSVTQLNQEVKHLLEHSFPVIYVEGEISNLARPASGHWYFSLKDDNAQVRCAMFKSQVSRLQFEVEHGTQVLIKARVSLYQARGDYQLIAESMEPAGIGKLQREFELLKTKLQKQGWFDDIHKKPIPEAPKTIGIITSASGAAIRDILRVLKRRYTLANVIIYPCLVQGNQAAKQIAAQIQRANERDEVDVLLLARGGGSLEDLWAFNEEVVAEAIFKSQLPIITGIGHQVDFTIADFVADLRAATPSAAAEIVSPDQSQWLLTIKRLSQHLESAIWQRLEQAAQNLDWFSRRLQRESPQRRLQIHHNELNHLAQQMVHALRDRVHDTRFVLSDLVHRLQAEHPEHRIKVFKASFKNLKQRLRVSTQQSLKSEQQQFAALTRMLNAVSPLSTLARGYSIAETPDGHVIDNAKKVKPKDHIQVRLAKGTLGCIVEKST